MSKHLIREAERAITQSSKEIGALQEQSCYLAAIAASLLSIAKAVDIHAGVLTEAEAGR